MKQTFLNAWLRGSLFVYQKQMFRLNTLCDLQNILRHFLRSELSFESKHRVGAD